MLGIWSRPMLYLTLNHIMPTFGDTKTEGFSKHCGEKEKMLVASIFSFSHNVFYPFQTKFQFFILIYFVFCKCFQFGEVCKILWLVKSLKVDLTPFPNKP